MSYMSVSLFKSFKECQAKTMAKLKGEWQPPTSQALLIGGYMDSLWDGQEALDKYILEHRPDLFTKQGKKRAEVQAADKAFMRAQREPLFVEYMSGEHQTIMTGEIEGVPYKIKMDSYIPDKMIIDEKYMKDTQPGWIEGEGKVTWIDLFHYDWQMAVYQEIVRQNTGKQLPCFLNVITKETEPTVEIVELPQWKLNSAMEIIKYYTPLFADIRDGKVPAERCEHCEYCKATKHIDKPMQYEDLLKSI